MRGRGKEPEHSHEASAPPFLHARASQCSFIVITMAWISSLRLLCLGTTAAFQSSSRAADGRGPGRDCKGMHIRPSCPTILCSRCLLLPCMTVGTQSFGGQALVGVPSPAGSIWPCASACAQAHQRMWMIIRACFYQHSPAMNIWWLAVKLA